VGKIFPVLFERDRKGGSAGHAPNYAKVYTAPGELHNAVMQGESEDAESGDILEVFQKGYKVKDRIIRHSMVKVAK
jgi:hypothetical protein